MKFLCLHWWMPGVWNPWTSQNAPFPSPWDNLLRLYCSHLQLLLVYGTFCIDFCLEIRRLIWSLKKSHLFALRNSRLLLQIALNQYPSTLWRCGWSVLQHLAESEQSITLYTSEFILRSVSSSSTGSHTWPVHNSLLPPCLTDHVLGRELFLSFSTHFSHHSGTRWPWFHPSKVFFSWLDGFGFLARSDLIS